MLHLALPTQLGFHGSKEIRPFIKHCLDSLDAGHGGVLLAHLPLVHQSVSLFVNKLIMLVKWPGLGQVRASTRAPRAAGNPPAQAAPLRPAKQPFRPIITKQERAPLAFELPALAMRQLKATRLIPA